MPFLHQGQFYESIKDALDTLRVISIHTVNLDNPEHYGINPATGRGQFKVNLTVDTEIAQDYLRHPQETEALLKSLPGTPLRFYQEFFPKHRQHWITWYDEVAAQKIEKLKTPDGYALPEQVGITHLLIDSKHPYSPNFFTAFWYSPYFHLGPCHRAQCFRTDLEQWILHSPNHVIILNENVLELKPKIINISQAEITKPKITRTRRA